MVTWFWIAQDSPVIPLTCCWGIDADEMYDFGPTRTTLLDRSPTST